MKNFVSFLRYWPFAYMYIYVHGFVYHIETMGTLTHARTHTYIKIGKKRNNEKSFWVLLSNNKKRKLNVTEYSISEHVWTDWAHMYLYNLHAKNLARIFQWIKNRVWNKNWIPYDLVWVSILFHFSSPFSSEFGGFFWVKMNTIVNQINTNAFNYYWFEYVNAGLRLLFSFDQKWIRISIDFIQYHLIIQFTTVDPLLVCRGLMSSHYELSI